MKPTRRASRWVIILGDSFDYNEGADVNRRLLGGEGNEDFIGRNRNRFAVKVRKDDADDCRRAFCVRHPDEGFNAVGKAHAIENSKEISDT